jgi:alpha-beta hydrolase superfamily lysophospholipase
MLDLFRRALLFWLSVFELLASWRGWWGLSWLGRAFPHKLLVPLPAAALRGARAAGWRRAAVALALAAPPALLLQIGASSLRNWALNPLLQLRPGRYPDRTIERLDIPMSVGYLPALHVIPQREARSFSSLRMGEELSPRSVKAAVCVIHGSGCDKTSYVWRLVDTLVSRGMAVLLIDLDGHGENPRAQSFPAITEDVDVAVAWLRERYRRVGLIGISLGGGVAARAVADRAIVDGLAVLEAPPLLHYSQSDVYREAAALARPHLLDLFSDCTAYNMLRAWDYAPIRATISTWDLIVALDLLGSLRRITAPLLLLYGASDAIVKPAQAEQVRHAIPPGATFRLVPGASHLTLILTPETLRTIGEWFGKTLAQDRE